MEGEDEDNVAFYLEAAARVMLLTNTLSQTGMCLLLVQHGVNMNALDNEDNSAVFYALRAGCTEVSAFLLQEGANCKETNRDAI